MARIALFGMGKMGRRIAELAQEQGDSVVDPKEAEVCLDFSHPSVVVEHVRQACALGVPIVIGTTGWEESEVRRLVESHRIGCLAAPNFSVGVALFKKVVTEAAALFGAYDASGIEAHHKEKVDAPSGTAKELAHLFEPQLPFSSVRCGSMPGTHTVVFDSPADSITLTHTARNRDGFAVGALRAAEWLIGKTGWYTLDDMLDSARLAVQR